MIFLGEDKKLNWESVKIYKQKLKDVYKISSANSMLAAVNSFLVFAGCEEWRVKPVSYTHLDVYKRQVQHQENVRGQCVWKKTGG